MVRSEEATNNTTIGESVEAVIDVLEGGRVGVQELHRESPRAPHLDVPRDVPVGDGVAHVGAKQSLPGPGELQGGHNELLHGMRKTD